MAILFGFFSNMFVNYDGNDHIPEMLSDMGQVFEPHSHNMLLLDQLCFQPVTVKELWKSSETEMDINELVRKGLSSDLDVAFHSKKRQKMGTQSLPKIHDEEIYQRKSFYEQASELKREVPFRVMFEASSSQWNKCYNLTTEASKELTRQLWFNKRPEVLAVGKEIIYQQIRFCQTRVQGWQQQIDQLLESMPGAHIFCNFQTPFWPISNHYGWRDDVACLSEIRNNQEDDLFDACVGAYLRQEEFDEKMVVMHVIYTIVETFLSFCGAYMKMPIEWPKPADIIQLMEIEAGNAYFDEMIAPVRKNSIGFPLLANRTCQYLNAVGILSKLETNFPVWVEWCRNFNLVKIPVVNLMRDFGRNDPCFCGSGKKYKRCCHGSIG